MTQGIYRRKFSDSKIIHDENAHKAFVYEVEHFIKFDSFLDTIFKASKDNKGKSFVYDYFLTLEEFNIKRGNYELCN